MMIFRFAWAFLLVGNASAQIPAGKTLPVYSWETCLKMAEENNAELRAARNLLSAAENNEKGNYSGYLPTLSGSLQVTRSGSGLVNGDNSSPFSASTSSTGYSAGLSASQSIFSGLQTYGQIRQAKANRIAAEISVIQAKAQLSYDLKTSFESMRYSREYVRFTTAIVKRRGENLRIVTLRFESGRENRGSVLLSEAYRDQAIYEDLQASNALKISRASLARAMGLDDFQEFEISGEVPVSHPEAVSPDMKALALESPDYLKSATSEEGAAAGVIVARSSFFPSLGVNGSYGRSGPTFFPNISENWSVSASLTLPFFSGGRDYFSLKSSIDNRSAAERQREGTLRSMVSRMQQTYASYIEAVQRVAVDLNFQKATAIRADIGRSKYNNGLLTFEDWDVIENDLISRERSYLLSKRDRVNAEASWELVRGKGAIP